MFAFLRQKHNAELVLDPSSVLIDENLFPSEDWTNSPYNLEKYESFTDVPDLLGKVFQLIAYVDADHAGDLITRRSRTGFIIYLNNAPILWTSKKQLSIETSTYGSEFTAMKQYCECLLWLRYKLAMMGIPCKYPSFIFRDNKSVLVNAAIPHSALKKKSCSISYHYIREGVAKDKWRVAYIASDDNRADLLPKPLAGGVKRSKFTSLILHHTEKSLANGGEYAAQICS